MDNNLFSKYEFIISKFGCIDKYRNIDFKRSLKNIFLLFIFLFKEKHLVCEMSGQKKQVKLYSWEYFKLCAIGGLFSCGLTHALITPVDLVKCRKQVKYKRYISSYLFFFFFLHIFSLFCLFLFAHTYIYSLGRNKNLFWPNSQS